MDSTASPFNFDANEWVVRIRQNLDKQPDEEETEIPVSIFNVPKALMVSHPYSYLPQQVAVGPYHYFSPEHYEMERYKIAASRRLQKKRKTASFTFHQVVEHIKCFDQKIRAHYHKYLNVNSDTLAWIMGMDVAFLLEFLQIYAAKEGKIVTTRVSSSMSSYFIDCKGTNLKSTHNVILRDILLLENQIPLFLLRKVLEFRFSSLESADEMLILMLIGLYKEVSPFEKMVEKPNNIYQARITKRAHLLDFLYREIMPELEEKPFEIIEVDHDDQMQDEAAMGEGESPMVQSSSEEKEKNSKLREIKRILISQPIEILLKVYWNIICNFPGIKLIKEPIDQILFPDQEVTVSSQKIQELEEIDIPSVTKLSKAGICFVPTNKGISSIKFDVKTKKFYLPKVYLDVNSEVVLRNLVAYESCIGLGPLVFTRYTELMNGIIDTQEDAKFLREKGIIVNQLKSDKEVADLWNGMSKSIKVTRVEHLDNAIEHVNVYYNGRWKTKAEKFMKGYVFASWKCLTLLAALFLLFLIALQAICTVYNCPRSLIGIKNVE
ncbi:hypothetical protein ACH5RR_008247 [Cinchona calisaya]|uniref:Uncharacterized protein n=1 Tax=Cinchona calisaya TaxID=153742 RepID=A0ABD3AEG8_9GENT